MAWDRSKPAASGFLVSAEIRQNWTALERSLSGVSLLADPTFLIWPAGDAAAPAHWSLQGAGAAVARIGTGLPDGTRKVGKYAAKVTAGSSAQAYLAQSLITVANYDDGFDGVPVSFGAWVHASNANTVRLMIDDGQRTTTSAYHSGDGQWQWLTVAGHVVHEAANRLQALLNVAPGGAGRISGAVFVVGEVPPPQFMPPPVAYGTLYFPLAGPAQVGARKAEYVFGRPGLVKDVQLFAKTGPVGAGVIVDVNHWDGAAYQSMFIARPQIAAGTVAGASQPDGTYRYRCFGGGFGTGIADGLLSVDVDQVGSTVAGADLQVHVRVLQFLRPLEVFLGPGEVA
jgi:hypothetical protein